MSRNINNHCSRRNCNKHYYNNTNDSCNTQLSCNDSCNTNLLSNLFSNAKKNNKLKWNNLSYNNEPLWVDGVRCDQMVIQVYKLLDEHFRNNSLNNSNESFKYGENHFLCLAALEENIRDGLKDIDIKVNNPKRLFFTNTVKINDNFGFMNIINPSECINDDKIKNIWDSLPIDLREAVNCLYKENYIPSYKVKTYYNINGEKLPEAKTVYLKHYFTLISKSTAELFQKGGYGVDLKIGNDTIKMYMPGPSGYAELGVEEEIAAVDRAIVDDDALTRETVGLVSETNEVSGADETDAATQDDLLLQLDSVKLDDDEVWTSLDELRTIKPGCVCHLPQGYTVIEQQVLTKYRNREKQSKRLIDLYEKISKSNRAERTKKLQLRFESTIEKLQRAIADTPESTCTAEVEALVDEISTAIATWAAGLPEENASWREFYTKIRTTRAAGSQVTKSYTDARQEWFDASNKLHGGWMRWQEAIDNEFTNWKKCAGFLFATLGGGTGAAAVLSKVARYNSAAQVSQDEQNLADWDDLAEFYGKQRAFLGFILWGEGYRPTSGAVGANEWNGNCCGIEAPLQCKDSTYINNVPVKQARTVIKNDQDYILQPELTTDDTSEFKGLSSDRLRTLTSRLCDKNGNKHGLLGFIYNNLDKSNDLFINKEYSLNDILHLMTQPAPQETAKDYQLMPFDYLTKWGGGESVLDGWSYDNENADLEPNGEIKYDKWVGKYGGDGRGDGRGALDISINIELFAGNLGLIHDVVPGDTVNLTYNSNIIATGYVNLAADKGDTILSITREAGSQLFPPLLANGIIRIIPTGQPRSRSDQITSQAPVTQVVNYLGIIDNDWNYWERAYVIAPLPGSTQSLPQIKIETARDLMVVNTLNINKSRLAGGPDDITQIELAKNGQQDIGIQIFQPMGLTYMVLPGDTVNLKESALTNAKIIATGYVNKIAEQGDTMFSITVSGRNPDPAEDYTGIFPNDANPSGIIIITPTGSRPNAPSWTHMDYNHWETTVWKPKEGWAVAARRWANDWSNRTTNQMLGPRPEYDEWRANEGVRVLQWPYEQRPSKGWDTTPATPYTACDVSGCDSGDDNVIATGGCNRTCTTWNNNAIEIYQFKKKLGLEIRESEIGIFVKTQLNFIPVTENTDLLIKNYKNYVNDMINRWLRIVNDNRNDRKKLVYNRKRRRLGGGLGLRIDSYEGVNGKGGFTDDSNVKYNGTLKRDERPSRTQVSLYNCGLGNLPIEFIDYWNRDEKQGWWYKNKFEELKNYFCVGNSRGRLDLNIDTDDNFRKPWATIDIEFDSDSKRFPPDQNSNPKRGVGQILRDMYNFTFDLGITSIQGPSNGYVYNLVEHGADNLTSQTNPTNREAWNIFWGTPQYPGLYRAVDNSTTTTANINVPLDPPNTGLVMVRNSDQLQRSPTDNPPKLPLTPVEERFKQNQDKLISKKRLIPREYYSDHNLEYGGAIGNINIDHINEAMTWLTNSQTALEDDSSREKQEYHRALGKYYKDNENPQGDKLTTPNTMRLKESDSTKNRLDNSLHFKADASNQDNQDTTDIKYYDKDPIDWHDYFLKQQFYTSTAAKWFDNAVTATKDNNQNALEFKNGVWDWKDDQIKDFTEDKFSYKCISNCDVENRTHIIDLIIQQAEECLTEYDNLKTAGPNTASHYINTWFQQWWELERGKDQTQYNTNIENNAILITDRGLINSSVARGLAGPVIVNEEMIRLASDCIPACPPLSSGESTTPARENKSRLDQIYDRLIWRMNTPTWSEVNISSTGKMAFVNQENGTKVIRPMGLDYSLGPQHATGKGFDPYNWVMRGELQQGPSGPWFSVQQALTVDNKDGQARPIIAPIAITNQTTTTNNGSVDINMKITNYGKLVSFNNKFIDSYKVHDDIRARYSGLKFDSEENLPELYGRIYRTTSDIMTDYHNDPDSPPQGATPIWDTKLHRSWYTYLKSVGKDYNYNLCPRKQHGGRGAVWHKNWIFQWQEADDNLIEMTISGNGLEPDTMVGQVSGETGNVKAGDKVLQDQGAGTFGQGTVVKDAFHRDKIILIREDPAHPFNHTAQIEITTVTNSNTPTILKVKGTPNNISKNVSQHSLDTNNKLYRELYGGRDMPDNSRMKNNVYKIGGRHRKIQGEPSISKPTRWMGEGTGVAVGNLEILLDRGNGTVKVGDTVTQSVTNAEGTVLKDAEIRGSGSLLITVNRGKFDIRSPITITNKQNQPTPASVVYPSGTNGVNNSIETLYTTLELAKQRGESCSESGPWVSNSNKSGGWKWPTPDKEGNPTLSGTLGMATPPGELDGGGLRAQGDPLVGVDIWGQSGLYENREQRNKRKRQFLFTDLYYMYEKIHDRDVEDINKTGHGKVHMNMTKPGSLSRIDLIKKFRESLSFMNSGRLLNLCIDYGIDWQPLTGRNLLTNYDKGIAVAGTTLELKRITADINNSKGGVMDYVNKTGDRIGMCVSDPINNTTLTNLNNFNDIKTKLKNVMLKKVDDCIDDQNGVVGDELLAVCGVEKLADVNKNLWDPVGQGIGAGYGYGMPDSTQGSIIRSKLLNQTVWNNNYITPGNFIKSFGDLSQQAMKSNVRGYGPIGSDNKANSSSFSIGLNPAENIMNMQDIVKRDCIIPPIEVPEQYDVTDRTRNIEQMVKYNLEPTSSRLRYDNMPPKTLQQSYDFYYRASTLENMRADNISNMGNSDGTYPAQSKTIQPEDQMYYQDIDFDKIRASVRPVRYAVVAGTENNTPAQGGPEYVIQAVYIEETKYNTGQTITEGGPNGCGEYRILDSTYDLDDLINGYNSERQPMDPMPIGSAGAVDHQVWPSGTASSPLYSDRYSQIWTQGGKMLGPGVLARQPYNTWKYKVDSVQWTGVGNNPIRSPNGTQIYPNNNYQLLSRNNKISTRETNTTLPTSITPGSPTADNSDFAGTRGWAYTDFNDFDIGDPVNDGRPNQWMNLFEQNIINELKEQHPGQGVFYPTGGNACAANTQCVSPAAAASCSITEKFNSMVSGCTLLSGGTHPQLSDHYDMNNTFAHGTAGSQDRLDTGGYVGPSPDVTLFATPGSTAGWGHRVRGNFKGKDTQAVGAGRSINDHKPIPKKHKNDGWVPFYKVDSDDRALPDTRLAPSELEIYKYLRRKYESYITRFDHTVPESTNSSDAADNYRGKVLDISILAERQRIKTIALDWYTCRKWVNDIVHNAAKIGCDIPLSYLSANDKLRETGNIKEGCPNGYRNMLFSSVKDWDEAAKADSNIPTDPNSIGSPNTIWQEVKDVLPIPRLEEMKTVDPSAVGNVQQNFINQGYRGPTVNWIDKGGDSTPDVLITWIPSPQPTDKHPLGYIADKVEGLPVRCSNQQGFNNCEGPGYDMNAYGAPITGSSSASGNPIPPYYPEGTLATGPWKTLNTKIDIPSNWRGLYEQYLRSCENETLCISNNLGVINEKLISQQIISTTEEIAVPGAATLLSILLYSKGVQWKRRRALQRTSANIQLAITNLTRTITTVNVLANEFKGLMNESLAKQGNIQVQLQDAMEKLTQCGYQRPKDDKGDDGADGEEDVDVEEELGDDFGEWQENEEWVTEGGETLEEIPGGQELGAVWEVGGTAIVTGIALGTALYDLWPKSD